MRLIARPLTADAFAPYGEVLAAPDAPGRTYIDAALANRRSHAKPSLSFTFKAPSALPLNSTTMERHLHSSQSFVPMEAGRWLVDRRAAWRGRLARHGACGGVPRARRPGRDLWRRCLAPPLHSDRPPGALRDLHVEGRHRGR